MQSWAKRASFAMALMAILPGWSHADSRKPLTAECLSRVSSAYRVHPDVLFAILIVEGGTVGRNSASNSNGTYDIGPFQVNSMHRRALNELGVSEEELRNDGCINAAVAAWQLRRALPVEREAEIKNEDDYLRAIARYHSATPKFNEIYANKLRMAFAYIYSEGKR